MKKLLMMAAIAALSSSALADETGYDFQYTWNIEIDKVASSYKMPEDLTAYLVGTQPNEEGKYQIYAYVRLAETIGSSDAAKTIYHEDLPSQAISGYLVMGGTHAIDYARLDVSLDATVASAGFVTLTTHFHTNEDIFTNLLRTEEPYTGEVDGLMTILSSEKTGLYQVISVNQAGKSVVASTTNFAPVPEPTSGLLLLLGVAGLALKRKRA